MSILGVDARKKIAELIKQIQEQSGGFGPPSAGYGDGKLYNGPEPVVGNAIKKVATFKPEIPFGTDIARKVVEGTENLGNQLVPPLELGPVKLTGSEQLDILLSGLLQKQKGEVENPAAKKAKAKSKVREPELSPVPTTVPDAVRRRLEQAGKIKPQPTIAPELNLDRDGFSIKSDYDKFLAQYRDRPASEMKNEIATRGNTTPEQGAKAKADIHQQMVEQREFATSGGPEEIKQLESIFRNHPDPAVQYEFKFVKGSALNDNFLLRDLLKLHQRVLNKDPSLGITLKEGELRRQGFKQSLYDLGTMLSKEQISQEQYVDEINKMYEKLVLKK